ncbi:MAG: beta strand repeat-containing protein [Solirubrobacteraceae bacterium]
MSGASVSLSPSTAAASAQYTIGFSVATALTGGSDTITIDASSGAPGTVFPSNANEYVVSDLSNPSSSGTVSNSPTISNAGATVTIVVPSNIAGGDAISLVITGVTNPASASTSATLAVSTSQDGTPAASAHYAITSSGAGAVSVSPSPSTAGATSQYTIGFLTAAALSGGTDTITIDASGGAPSTVFPSEAGDYLINDLTDSAGSGTVSNSPTFTNGAETVTVVVPSNIAAGDAVSLVITGVTNPASASPSTTLALFTSQHTTPITSGAYAITASPVTIGPVNGTFYPNPNNSGPFDTSQLSSPVFSEQFPVINFNPPVVAQGACANATGVDEWNRPYTDVITAANGQCGTEVAQGNGSQAGCGDLETPDCLSLVDLYQFEAVYRTMLNVSQTGQVTFDFYSDDGWILAIGPSGSGNQPTYVSGSLYNAPSTGGAVSGYPVVGAYNTGSSPVENTVTVSFPNAGTYPVEVDYTECCGGQDALLMGTSFGTPLPPATPPSAPTITSVSPNAGSVAGGTSVSITGTGFSTVPGATIFNFGDGNPATNVSCPTTTSCTAISPAGSGTVDVTATVDGLVSARNAADQFTFALAPSNTGLPTITGSTIEGQTLTEAHGTWTNNPTSYGYQWEDCDISGNNCSNIPGATSQTYQLTANDVGHTLRVQETATNAGGTSTPATSAQTAVVTALPPACQPTITSVSPISPTANQTITITGSCFGSQQPYDGDSRYIQVTDLTKNWAAGYCDPSLNPPGSCVPLSSPSDAVGLNVVTWTDTQIQIAGFTVSYGQYNWTLDPGDQIQIQVWNPQTQAGPAVYTTTVTAPATQPPSINSFSPSCAQTLASSGGNCRLQWTVSNATTCSLSSSPDVLGGTQSVGCAASATNTKQVTFPANTGTSPVSYTFTLTAAGVSDTTPAVTQTTVTVTAPPSYEVRKFSFPPPPPLKGWNLPTPTPGFFQLPFGLEIAPHVDINVRFVAGQDPPVFDSNPGAQTLFTFDGLCFDLAHYALQVCGSTGAHGLFSGLTVGLQIGPQGLPEIESDDTNPLLGTDVAETVSSVSATLPPWSLPAIGLATPQVALGGGADLKAQLYVAQAVVYVGEKLVEGAVGGASAVATDGVDAPLVVEALELEADYEWAAAAANLVAWARRIEAAWNLGVDYGRPALQLFGDLINIEAPKLVPQVQAYVSKIWGQAVTLSGDIQQAAGSVYRQSGSIVSNGWHFVAGLVSAAGPVVPQGGFEVLPVQPLRLTVLRSIRSLAFAPAVLSRASANAAARALVKYAFRTVTVRPLLVSSFAPHANHSLCMAGGRLSQAGTAVVELSGPQYRGEKLIRTRAGVAGACVDLPQHMAAGRWFVAIVDYNQHQSRSGVLVDAFPFLVKKTQRR